MRNLALVLVCLLVVACGGGEALFSDAAGVGGGGGSVATGGAGGASLPESWRWADLDASHCPGSERVRYQGPNDAACTSCACELDGGTCDYLVGYPEGLTDCWLRLDSQMIGPCDNNAYAGGNLLDGLCHTVNDPYAPTNPHNFYCTAPTAPITLTSDPVCSLVAGGGTVTPIGPFDATLAICETEGASCVEHEGDVACPDAYPHKERLYASAEDERSCSACSCGDPTDTGCTDPVFEAFDALSCTGSHEVLQLACTATPELLNGGSLEMTAAPTVLGTCTPSGGEPSGAVVPQGESTLCCADGA